MAQRYRATLSLLARQQLPGHLDGLVGTPADEQAMDLQAACDRLERRRHAVDAGQPQLVERTFEIATHLGCHGGDRMDGEVDDRMVVRTGNGGRPLGERDQSGDVASGVGGDRTDRERDDLAVVAAARAEGLGRCVDVGVDAAVGEVEGLADHGVQQARLGRVGPAPFQHPAPRPHGVDRQRGDGATDHLQRDLRQRVEVVVGDGDGAGACEVPVDHELGNDPRPQVDGLLRVEDVQERGAPQLVGAKPTVLRLRDEGNRRRQVLQVDVRADHVPDAVPIRVAEVRQREQGATLRHRQAVEHFLAGEADRDVGPCREREPHERRPAAERGRRLRISAQDGMPAGASRRG